MIFIAKLYSHLKKSYVFFLNVYSFFKKHLATTKLKQMTK